MSLTALVPSAIALGGAPLLVGIINRTKAVVAGRTGQPLLQPYNDVIKLLKKGAVYSRTTSWVFRAGPVVGLAATITALGLLPIGGLSGAISFSGDLILFAYLFGLMRFATVIAALDTGSSFEGMGASREVTFAALAEPGLLLGLAALARLTGCVSLSPMYAAIGSNSWGLAGSSLALVAAAFLVVFLAENGRMPVDDPNTHLELTMIHEVMVLDHSGPDLAFILYTSALKLWVLGALVVGLVVPVRSGNAWVDLGAALAGMAALAVGVGLLESSMARWRLIRLPQLLIGGVALSALALMLILE